MKLSLQIEIKLSAAQQLVGHKVELTWIAHRAKEVHEVRVPHEQKQRPWYGIALIEGIVANVREAFHDVMWGERIVDARSDSDHTTVHLVDERVPPL